MVLVPGKSYCGYGGVNEYGETFFRPSQKGSRPGSMSLVKDGADYKLYESAKLIKISIVIEKNLSMMERVKFFMKAFHDACVEIKNLKM